MANKLRVGIIGTGGISRSHMAGYKKLQHRVEVVAACDIDEAKLTAYGKEYGIPHLYTDFHEMIAKENLDCVSVCTWNSVHKDATIAALRGGAHVICEKPMAMNTKEAEEMLAVSKETGKLLQIGFVRRFGNDAAALKAFIDDGVFGDIYYAKATYLRRSGCPGGWFGDKARSGGGPLIDLGVHVIDLVRYLAGLPNPVSAYGATYNNLGPNRAAGAPTAWAAKGDAPYTVEDFTTALIKFDNGLTVSVEASFNLNIKKDVGNIELFGTKAGCRIDPEVELYTQMAGRFVNVSPAASTALSFNGLFEKEICGFVDAAEGLAPCRATAEDGVALMKIIDAIYESAETGKSVEIHNL
ncbi:MAG: Gfo/Idh/MocA family oxidoreductase [Ruminococcaceae bacterium]|nr:Gfo/Idh/MocA family oxidoreductase [Oscillospiraceae bacterium]